MIVSLLALVISQGAKAPKLPPVTGSWGVAVISQKAAAQPPTANIGRSYRLSVFPDGSWQEKAAQRKQGEWKFLNGVLTLRIMRGEDLWSVEKKFLLDKDGKLTQSDVPYQFRLRRVSVTPRKL